MTSSTYDPAALAKGAPQESVRVATEFQVHGGRWVRDSVRTHEILPSNRRASGLHLLAAEVMGSHRYGYVPDSSSGAPRDTVGRPLRALVLPADPADGDDDEHALYVWGGAVAAVGGVR